MKNKFFAGLFFGLCLCLAFIGGFAASSSTRQVLPAAWGTPYTGFGLDISARPVATIAGTNFTGSTTNVAFTNTAFKASFKNGIYVGEVPLTQ